MSLNKSLIKNQRISLGLTLEQVGEIVGVGKSTIMRYENGTITNIPSDKIELLAKTLQVTPAKLMGWEDGKFVNQNTDESPSETFILTAEHKSILKKYAKLNAANKREMHSYAEFKSLHQAEIEKKNKNEDIETSEELYPMPELIAAHSTDYTKKISQEDVDMVRNLSASNKLNKR